VTIEVSDDVYQLALLQFAADTAVAFAVAFAGLPSMVEWYSHFDHKMKSQTARDAIFEELEYVDSQEAFIAVLRDSKCPLVAALKKSIVDAYIKRHGHDVAEIRSEA